MEMKEIKTNVIAIIDPECNIIGNLSNISSVIFNNVDDLNWVGFYLSINNELQLGPFQGNLACTRIKYGKGVCGSVADSKNGIIVPNVHDFAGHIACDSASNSEMVLPILYSNGHLFGVFDIDSTRYNRFSQEDYEVIESIVSEIQKLL